jgi:hypothetical protein
MQHGIQHRQPVKTHKTAPQIYALSPTSLVVLVVVGALQIGQSTLAGVPESDPSGVTRSALGTPVAAVVVGYGGGISALDMVLRMSVCLTCRCLLVFVHDEIRWL